ncbi:MAG: arginine--tRNA ligase [Candidatus Aenigmarchaeota archaeon]|nr:arginine--tRNA ligase [Candidatus Aenigmarchaeota archaeon]
MDPYEKLKADIIKSIALPEAALETPPQITGADLALPCFSLAKKFKKPPAAIARELAEKAKPRGLISRIEATGPYLNFFADWESLGNLLLNEILAKKEGFGSGKMKEKIMVEFAHPNTHKAFHIGHIRNIALGESLSRLLEKSGYKVVRTNYQGDIGPHVAKCLWGLLHLGKTPPAKDKGIWLGEIYAEANQKISDNPKREEEVREINKKLYAGDPSLRKLWKQTRKWSLDYFESVYKDFGSKFDRLYFESEVEAPGIKLAKTLLNKGVAKKSEGAIVMDLKKWDLGVYVLLTQDQTPLYSVKDFVLASLQDKEFHPSRIIHVVGTEQILHFRQLFKSLELTNPVVAKKENHLPYELVNLKSGKISSREGRVITYDSMKKEILAHAIKETKKHSPNAPAKTAESVALGGIKYDMIKQSPEKTIMFDWEQALSFEGNAAPYLQYTHARACSILRKAKPGKCDARHLKEEKELLLMRKLLTFPGTVQAAARDLRPHYIANYAYQLASLFNDFYQAIPVIGSPQEKARLALVQAVQLTLGNSLKILGITAPEKM